MSLIILNKSPRLNIFSPEIYKRLGRKIFNKTRGPQAVTASLCRGLDEIKYEYKLNPPTTEITENDIVWVNESIEALRFAIKLKGGKNYRLIAGPNLIIVPEQSNGIISSAKIDIILQPSDWTKNFMASLKPDLDDKIKVWPAGVAMPILNESLKTNGLLVYLKDSRAERLLPEIRSSLQRQNRSFEIIKYNKFQQSEYFAKLGKSRALIYLGNSESQGLALQEAWARNIPTLVLNKEYFEYKKYKFPAEKISAPYLNDQNGIFFDTNNFEEKFLEFWSKLTSFQPREYVLNNLSDKICAQKFLAIINN